MNKEPALGAVVMGWERWEEEAELLQAHTGLVGGQHHRIDAWAS